jgi:hypothetical protein
LAGSAGSSRQSSESGGSIDLPAFQGSLEVVLTWLLEAEETLQQQADVIGNTVQAAKDLFHKHEVRHTFTYTLNTDVCELEKQLCNVSASVCCVCRSSC